MIYLVSQEGQMCNQLISLAAVCSLGIEYETNVICPNIDMKLKKYFLFNEKIDKISIKVYGSKRWKMLYFCYKIFAKIFKIRSKKKFDKNKSNKNQYFYDRISFFEPEVFVKHIDGIRLFLDFKPEVKEHCKSMVSGIFRNNVTIIGVHIRRGDYKFFNNGEWYYSDEEYAMWMRKLASDRHVKFLICSNEKVDLGFYQKKGLDVCRIGSNAIEDLCLLSMCDYIMGPPSTYSLWAALISDKKRWIIDNRNYDIRWEKAKLLQQRIKEGESVC